MRVGKLDKLVTFKRPVEVQADSGELETTYVPLSDKSWASITMLNGRELFTAQQAQVTTNARIVTRFRKDVTTKMIIVYKPHADQEEDVYEINYIGYESSKYRDMVLMCTHLLANGLKRGGSNG